MQSIFINDYGYTQDWIMSKIAHDILENARTLGYECNIGRFEDYKNEDIVYHLDYHQATPIPAAKHNSVFYTHLNDVLQETALLDLANKFDSFICMSQEDAQFMIEMGVNRSKVFGKVLPVRNTYVKPFSIGIFSACYADGRKNEQWLIDYCKDRKIAKYINFIFIGKGWNRVVNELEKFNCTYEWHNVSRQLPYEYQFQQNKLADLNCYIYMGMDGGAMGTYDAYAQGVPLCVTFDGFHKAIPHIDYSFDNKTTFFEQMDIICQRQKDRLLFFNSNNPKQYVEWLISVWTCQCSDIISEYEKQCISYSSVLEKKRKQYYDISMSRLRTYLSWMYNRYKYYKFLKKKSLQ